LIESEQNQFVKELVGLKQRKNRDKAGVFLVEGLRFVLEIPQNWDVISYAISDSFEKLQDISIFQQRAQLTVFADKVFSRFCDTENPQGILAVCKQKNWEIQDVMEKENCFFLLAEELNDPGNLGTIIRTADACGADGIFLSNGSVDLYNPKVLRATMGSLFHIPVLQNQDICFLIDQLKEKGVQVLAAHLSGEKDLYDFNLKNACAMVVGNEARGLSDETAKRCSAYLKIPMPGKAESLNASIAAGVILYEVVRQRKSGSLC